ncbi:hypothetical protein CC78DRAFT_498764 [Lojkania enalia]|uniref:F-box domain-containing protein n=1 Tax=Lojkania enalia TaxID=147567 RepID=A0A9P4K6J8_9PLEO|nr:hypothetical protein CC78DRAFT_498764 [Didymosphaeria enalia]
MSTEEELESFRRQWREEVTAKAKGKAPSTASPSKTTQAFSSRARAPKSNATEAYGHKRHQSLDSSDEIDEIESHAYHELGEKRHERCLDETGELVATSVREPRSALEHYERAVEKETQGIFGDSVNLYRKAFRLDSRVHETYKNKHFPASSFPKPKTQDPNPSNAAVNAHHFLHGLPSTLQSLIESFSSLSIQREPPPTDLSPAPSCPIASIPEEILADILVHLAIRDVASFVRLAQVCKRLAYLVATEERVWRRVALGHEFGFAAMHYTWACQVDGRPLDDNSGSGHVLNSASDTESLDIALCLGKPAALSPPSLTQLLVPTVYPTYRTLFRHRPRLRFNGCYVSTVNYTRPGASSPTSISWNSPIHIVTYYRYLRFFRNGIAISLLTTAEPADVVPYLHIEHVHKNHGNLPPAPMKDALLGRWRLSGPEVLGDREDEPKGEKEGTLYVETEGVTPKYLYKMVLALGSAGRGTRNNKLVWQGYWSYNRLTDDWAEFGLKNDRPFYWGRVKSYGMGLGQRS